MSSRSKRRRIQASLNSGFGPSDSRSSFLLSLLLRQYPSEVSRTCVAIIHSILNSFFRWLAWSQHLDLPLLWRQNLPNVFLIVQTAAKDVPSSQFLNHHHNGVHEWKNFKARLTLQWLQYLSVPYLCTSNTDPFQIQIISTPSNYFQQLYGKIVQEWSQEIDKVKWGKVCSTRNQVRYQSNQQKLGKW